MTDPYQVLGVSRYEIVREKREKDSVNEVTGNDL